MTTYFKIELENYYINLKINIMKNGIVRGFPYNTDNLLHQRYKVTISTQFSDKSFFFYDSYQNYLDKKSLTENDVPFILYCIFTDAIEGLNSFNEFCANMGFSEDSIRAYKIYRACRNTYHKLRQLGFDENMIYETVEFLQEKYDV